ncbi:MAG TPA: CehA/McbA family metallohydrolase [archaeon]|nr:CehA/McbA family metallohydrolase [archaeon]
MIAELHCHTNYSDGYMTLRKAVETAEEIGLNALAITDHNTTRACKLFGNIKTNLLLIPGIEISCYHEKQKGHVLALGINEFKGSHELLETIDFVHSCGGIAINAHPFGGIKRPGFSDENIARKFDAIEIVNGMTFDFQNKKAAELAKKLNMPAVCGSDAHMPGDIGNYPCRIRCNNDIDSVLNAIKKGRAEILVKNTSSKRILAKRGKRLIQKPFKKLLIKLSQ